MVGLLLTGTAVAIAGAPAVFAGVRDLRESRALVGDAELAGRTVALSHLLADEREAVVAALGAADPGAVEAALPDDARTRVDSQSAALGTDVGAAVRASLDAVPAVRDAALSGRSDPAETFEIYSDVIAALDGVLRGVSRGTPERAADPTADALPDLARAVDASSAVRGLLLAALAGGDGQSATVALAQREAARESAALTDFRATADGVAREDYERTVAGDEVRAAATLLTGLADAATLSAEERDLDPAAVGDALSTRTGFQRDTLLSLAEERTASLQQLADDDMTRLQITAGIVLAALVLAFSVSVHTARSLTQPLAAVRLGSRRVAADPTGQEPVRFTGRNDEFAEVVHSVNALRARVVTLQQQAATAARDADAAARDSGGLRAERDRLLAEHNELNARLAALHGAVHGMFAHHARRLLLLVGEQLSVIEGLEEHEADPDRLAVLFTVDHLAARMRRHGENLMLLAGAEPAPQLGEPLSLIDVARAAVSEIERYELVETAPPPPAARIVGGAARDVSHLLAELLDNATAFSPAGARVRLTGRWGEGELIFTVEDDGVGLSPERLAELNARLADPVTPPPGAGSDAPGVGIGMGLYTVARLAARHRLRCWLDTRPGGGTVAHVIVPGALVEPLSEPYPSEPYPSEPARPARARPPIPAQARPQPPPPPAARAAETVPEHGRATDTISRTNAVTESGLPLRNPLATGVGPSPQPTTGRARAVDAEELRRRLGGFQRGAREGHRDAARAAGPYPGEAGEELPS
ncbi:sensor histidine kinase [Streptomyces sp. NBC_01803]|uniref:sensor histidine kinase n=1 Tax=Streptomyces sp. NBC_01803 TaxID=2975946 RepID=UPI002DDC6DF8|nr:sensor histidine kinase [Streptomyces sp. NBC_01803]WSA44288.1 sensor histidine kinase [Streptomyces sp. NBC_01803]